jgi:diguanylate cyclase (GGDEF)-like protein
MHAPEADSLLEGLLVASGALIAARLGASGEIRWANARLTGLLAQDPVGADILDLVAEPHRPRLAALLAAADPGEWKRSSVGFTTGPSAVPLDYDFSVVGEEGGILLVGEPVLEATESASRAFDGLADDLISEQRRMHGEARRLRDLAVTDPLTGIANRRALTDGLDKVLTTAVATGKTLSVVMIDLDHFKAVNDTHGHAAGDSVLAATADVLRAAGRQGDLVTRYGGEEFVVVLADCGAPEALRWAERARLRLRETVVPGIERQVTASFGVATSTGSETAAILLARADAAMYQAKTAGRDRVVHAQAEVGAAGGR